MSRPHWAYLYRLDLAVPKRAMTPARWEAIERCNAARRVCPTCGHDAGYRIPRSLGECWPCAALRHDQLEDHDPDLRGDEAATGVAVTSTTYGREAA